MMDTTNWHKMRGGLPCLCLRHHLTRFCSDSSVGPCLIVTTALLLLSRFTDGGGDESHLSGL